MTPLSRSWHWWAATVSAACVARLGAVADWWRSWPMANTLACLCSYRWWTFWTYLMTVNLFSLYLMNLLVSQMYCRIFYESQCIYCCTVNKSALFISHYTNSLLMYVMQFCGNIVASTKVRSWKTQKTKEDWMAAENVNFLCSKWTFHIVVVDLVIAVWSVHWVTRRRCYWHEKNPKNPENKQKQAVV